MIRTSFSTRVLVLGYGNPGRGDDGLGPALARAMELRGNLPADIESVLQLELDHAVLFNDYATVILADADRNAVEPFSLSRVLPIADVPFTSHSMSPQALLFLARELFHAKLNVFLLGIRGYSFELSDGLSKQAAENLKKAEEHLLKVFGTFSSS